MKHQRPDYKGIIDTDKIIGEDEPVFLLRAKDTTAPIAIRAWAAAQRQLNQFPDDKIIQQAEEWATKMEEWQIKNGHRFADL